VQTVQRAFLKLNELKKKFSRDQLTFGVEAFSTLLITFVLVTASSNCTILCLRIDLKMDFENSRLKEEEMSATSIPLLRFNDEIEQWSVHSEGASYLRDLRGKSLVITSIAGRYRSGKSFLLNKLIGKDVFGVSSSCNGCTQGIDMWCESSGDAVLVFLDTAGLFDTENHGSPDHDIKLMMLTIMISSVFIYAVNSVIDENLIKQLE
jgi:predicted GTPase